MATRSDPTGLSSLFGSISLSPNKKKSRSKKPYDPLDSLTRTLKSVTIGKSKSKRRKGKHHGGSSKRRSSSSRRSQRRSQRRSRRRSSRRT